MLKDHDVCQHGFRVREGENLPFLINDLTIMQFIAAEVWLQKCIRGPKITTRISSYRAKHSAEKMQGPNASYGYVSNGALIVAALENGFSVKPTEVDSMNAFFNFDWAPARDCADVLEACSGPRRYMLNNAAVREDILHIWNTWNTALQLGLKGAARERFMHEHAGGVFQVKESGGTTTIKDVGPQPRFTFSVPTNGESMTMEHLRRAICKASAVARVEDLGRRGGLLPRPAV